MKIDGFEVVLTIFAIILTGLAIFLLIFQKKIHKRVIRYFRKRDDEF